MDGNERTRIIREIGEIEEIINRQRVAGDPETRWAIRLLEWCVERRLFRLHRTLRAVPSGRER